VVANLKARQMKFGLSEGMILAGVGDGRLGRLPPLTVTCFRETKSPDQSN
jgi:tRNA-binding EMAP/Myf-like protein